MQLDYKVEESKIIDMLVDAGVDFGNARTIAWYATDTETSAKSASRKGKIVTVSYFNGTAKTWEIRDEWYRARPGKSYKSY